MLPTLPHLQSIQFPRIERDHVNTLQVNLGYLCNLQCQHCHVNAGPSRTEVMSADTVQQVMTYLQESSIDTLDLTGGAPELNPYFRILVQQARAWGRQVVDRTNLSVLLEPGQEDLAHFLARQQVQVVASLPCYLEENVDKQRGQGVFQDSITALRKLNALGYGQPGSGLMLNLVYNPQGTDLPPPQETLEADYKQFLKSNYGVTFNDLLTICNMPIHRFGSALLSKGKFDEYMSMLQEAHRDENLAAVMCRRLLSVDWLGYVYDCDFNQMLGLPMQTEQRRLHISELLQENLEGRLVATAGHCYGCTAGQGSSCGGALA